MKLNNKKEVPQANRIFTDREEPRKVFWDSYNLFKNNLKNSKENDIKVITYYGIGGIGKTSLLKQIRKELKDNSKQPIYIHIDFEENNDMFAVLTKIRDLFQKQFRFDFPMFDLANYAFLQKQGKNIKKEELKNLISDSHLLSSLLDIGSAIPAISNVITLVRGVDNFNAALRNMFDNSKKELNEIKNDEPDVILRNMPYYLACDLENNLKNQREPLVVFIDTYEVLVNELAGIGEPLEKDKWIRDEKRGLIVNIPNAIWVIASRDKLKWEQINPDWKGTLDQHLLGNLSDVDAYSFLAEAGVSNQNLIKEIYQLTEGVPLYLDICVDRYNSIIEKSEVPHIEDIGSNTYELITRFVKYMDDNKKALVYIISCLDEWTEELLNKLVNAIMPGFSFVTLNNIKNYSFILTEDEKIYKMHQAIRSVIYNDCDKRISNKINKYMEDYLYEILEINTLYSADYANTVKRYLLYKLRGEFKTEDDFIKFYNETFAKLHKNLIQSYQYDEACSLDEILIKYSTNRFGYSKATSTCYLKYSVDLYFAGNYNEALNIALKAYECFKQNIGEDHPDTISAMRNLAISYRKTGQYQIALTLSKKAADLRTKILGEEHPSTVNDMVNLAISYRKAGNYEEALKISKKVADVRTKTLGEEHPSTISAMSCLANAYRQTGKNEEALSLSKEVADVRARILGEEHPATIAALGGLAHSYRLVGKYEESSKLSERVVALRTRILGEEHPDTTRAMNNLANSYRKTGKYEEALSLSEKVVNIRSRILGVEHPATIGALSNLASSYRKTIQYQNALILAKKVFDWRKKNYGEEHPATIRSMNNLANSYRKIGKYEEALSLSEKVAALSLRILGVEHHATIASMHNLTLSSKQNSKSELFLELDDVDLDEEDSEDLAEETYETTVI